MKGNRLAVVLGFGIVAAVIATLGIWLLNIETIGFSDLVIIFTVLALALGATWIMLQRARDIRAGFKPEDEMSKKAAHKAGYYAYISSVWTAVGMMWLNIFLTEEFGFPDFSTSFFVGAVVIIPGLVFIGLTLWFRKKGNVE